MNTVEFLDNVAHAEGSEVSQVIVPGSKVTGDQELFSDAESNIVNVLASTLLNMRPLLTFLVMAETMLSRSRSTLKSFLARAIISVT